MGKKILVPLIVFLIIAGFGIFSFFRSTTPVATVSAMDVADFLEEARVEAEEGNVQIKTKEGKVIPVKGAEKIHTGEAVMVEVEGSATLYWPDGSVSRIKGPAEITVNEVSTSAGGLDQKVDVQVNSGEVWTKVMDMMSENSSVTVRTQNTVAGIRGTSLYHKVIGGRELVRTFEHGVQLQVKDGKEQPLLEDEQVTFENDKEKFEKTEEEIPWVENVRDLDAIYMKELEKKRNLLLQKNALETKVDIETTLKDIAGSSLTDMQKKARILAALDSIVGKANVLRDAKNTEQLKKISEQMSLLIGELKKMNAKEGESGQEETNKRIQFYQRLLFGTGTPDEFIDLRAQLFNERTELLPEEKKDDRLGRMIMRETFFAHDLASDGNSDDASKVMKLLTGVQAEEGKIFDKGDLSDKEIFEKMTEKLGAIDPKLDDAFMPFKKRFIGEKDLSAMDTLKAAFERSDREAVMKIFRTMSTEEKRMIQNALPGLKEFMDNKPVIDTQLEGTTGTNSNVNRLVKPIVPLTTNANQNALVKPAIKPSTNTNTVLVTPPKEVLPVIEKPVPTPLPLAPEFVTPPPTGRNTSTSSS